MMEHLTDITIIEFTAGNLNAQEAKEVQRHIADCNECSARVLEFRSQWDGLGKWEEDTDVKDLSIAIHQRINGQVLRPEKGWSLFLHRFVFKAAAIILFGAMLGFLTGRYNTVDSSDSNGAAVPEYMQSLSLAYTSELTWAAMETGFEQGSDK